MLTTKQLAKLPDRDDLADMSYDFLATPVETTTGNELRLRAIDALSVRAGALQERQARQRLTVIEQRELMDSQSAIHTLQRMAPTGPLQTPDRELV